MKAVLIVFILAAVGNAYAKKHLDQKYDQFSDVTNVSTKFNYTMRDGAFSGNITPRYVYLEFTCKGKQATCVPDTYRLLIIYQAAHFQMSGVGDTPIVQFLFDGKRWEKHGTYDNHVNANESSFNLVNENVVVLLNKEELATLLAADKVDMRVAGISRVKIINTKDIRPLFQ